jgi:hypothetical protein
VSALHLGWTPDPGAVESVIADTSTPVYRPTENKWGSMGAPDWSDRGKAPIILFDSLKALHPTWKRGNQGIGDCVSWGWELGTTIAVAVDIHQRFSPYVWPGEFATEPYYGGARVEARGIRRGGRSDGAVGAYAAKFGIKWGALARIDWSKQTGNAEHNLTQYSGKKAKDWGDWGCGGQWDKDALDNLAKLFGLTEAPQVNSFDQAAQCIESGFPIAVCSSQGLSDKRDKYGFVRGQGIWYHCMVFSGLRYDRPGLLDTNSWGNSWGLGNFYVNTQTGEVIDYWPEVQKCSAWVDASTCDKMLRQGDSYAVCGINGLQRREINWAQGWEIT